MNEYFQRIITYVIAVAIFATISIGYFAPSIFQKKALHQLDIRKGYAMGADLREHYEETGEKSLWASRMFSGMPTYQISPSYGTAPIQAQLRNAFELWLPSPANYLFGYMLGFFILLIALRVNPWVAIVGAIAYGFSSYFFIIITAGHIWKVCVLELIPPTIAGIVWAYRGKYLLGGAVTALFFSLQLYSNHIQMTYYSLLFVGILVVGRFIYDFREKELKRFAKATAVLLFAALLGFGANASSLILTQKYSEQTIRGKSELTSNSEDKTSGLDKSYATQWSYGIGETFTLLIPNAKGGASEAISERNSSKVKEIVKDPQFREVIAGQSSYFGNQPFTSGPVYVGAFIMFLFILGIFVVRGYLKWVLLIATIMSILLSWGSNFMPLTDLFLDYFPFYNKMRTVSSILVIAELCIPILAMLAFVEIIENPEILKTKKRALYASLGLTAGVTFIFILMPKAFFSFVSDNEAKMFVDLIKENQLYAALKDNLEEVRVAIFRADAWRTLIIILLGYTAILLYSYRKIGKYLLIPVVGLIVLLDLFTVNKRYLSAKDFVPKSKATLAFEKTSADEQILKDTDPNYRVLNLSVSPFQDASTSYYHKSIGGYHAAKLRRYQDVIDGYLSTYDMNVLSMLNTRYIIVPNQEKGVLEVQQNPMALGNAWFVDTLQMVKSADEEFAALQGLNPAKVAVVDARFIQALEGLRIQPDSAASIEMMAYKINDISYKTNTSSEQLAVFSEIYYNDGLTCWEATIDGKPAPIIRANYILRALRIPEGEHTVQLVFKPQAYYTLEKVSMACLIVLLAFVCFAGVRLLVVKKSMEE